MKAKLIAPCGMNCSLCIAYQRDNNNCPGCRSSDIGIRKSRWHCKIKNCDKLKRYCYECDEFPCKKIKHLDKRYRTKYNMSMIENLNNIKKYGIRKFVQDEKKRWTCPCGGIICVHKDKCLACA